MPPLQNQRFKWWEHVTKTEHVAGAIFLDSDNNADFSDDKNIIYGHNMKDGSMFRGLRNFLDDEFLKEHHILYLYLPDEGVWIFVVVKCEYTRRWRYFLTWNAGGSPNASSVYLRNRCLQTSGSVV